MGGSEGGKGDAASECEGLRKRGCGKEENVAAVASSAIIAAVDVGETEREWESDRKRRREWENKAGYPT